MLKGQNITLRPVREADLARLRELDLDLDSRGDYWPLGIMSEVAYRDDFARSGFWGENFGRLVMIDAGDEIIGEIMYFKTVPYMEEFEIGYRLFGKQHWGKGATTEALQLLTRYLFDSKNINRIRLCIDVENAGSLKVAQKGGYKHEGTMHGCMFHRGRHHDMELYAITRGDIPLA
ncbi:MAG: GNAT family N-acetyltransferase [Chloroflexi bacterium]|nr:MAG: GNAT family N-acetyltransferase [Chloroflexota bacterium]